jgi:hypothetical protein
MFSAPGLIFGSKVVGFRFHILRVRTHFRRYRGRRVRFACFAFPDSYSAVPRASTPVFMFCVPKHFFNGVEGVGSYFHVLKSRTHFRRFRQRLVPFSCFGLPDSFLAVPRTSAPVFMFYAPGLVFDGTEGVGSRFHVLRTQTRFRRCPVCRVPFSCFARPNSFSTVQKASGPVFMFCSLGLIFGGTEGVRSHMFWAPEFVFGGSEVGGSRFHVLPSQTHFRRYRRRWFPFSCFACPDTFLAVPRASGPVFMFCAPGLVYGGVDCVGCHFHDLRARNSHRRYRGRLDPFSCFALPESFSAVPRASDPVFMFCATEIVFGGTEGVGSGFHVSRSRTYFQRYRGRRLPF